MRTLNLIQHWNFVRPLATDYIDGKKHDDKRNAETENTHDIFLSSVERVETPNQECAQ